MTEVERLARKYFELFRRDRLGMLEDVLHPDVVLVLHAVQPGTEIRGRDELIAFLEREFARRLWDITVHRCSPIDATRIAVEGRIRWMDDERVMRDDPRVWALEFRDGLLVRSVPCRSFVEAETILSAPARPDAGDASPDS